MEKYEANYKVKEPTVGINYTSQESKKLFLESLQDNTANPFFELSDQFNTQTYGSYCGPTNISIILNAMGIDPKSIIFSNWKWYNEKNIHSCNIESVHDHGMPLTDMKFIFEKNKVKTILYRPYCEFNKSILLQKIDFDINALSDKNKFENLILYEDLTKFKYSTIKNIYLQKAIETGENFVFYNLVDENFFRICVLASNLYNNFYIVCNVHRNQLGQEGGGHFLPVMAYNMRSDYILLFDCARYKYNSRWHKVKTVFEALTGKDRVGNVSRGFIVAIKPINKNIFLITKEQILNINKHSIEKFLDKLKFDNIKDKAYFFNWLIINEFETVEELLWEEGTDLWEKIIPNLYKSNEKLKNFIDFLFMFDRLNIKTLILGSFLYFNN